MQLQIVTWFDDPTDTALLDLIPYLQGLAAAPSAVDYMSKYAPPASVGIVQPDLSPWLFGPPSDVVGGGGGGGANGMAAGAAVGYYDDEGEEEDDEDVDDEDLDGVPLAATQNVITMAARPSQQPAPPPPPPSPPSGEVVTAT